ncbi:MAG: caspase family protein, partial [Cyanobacteria bacterium J06650_10]
MGSPMGLPASIKPGDNHTQTEAQAEIQAKSQTKFQAKIQTKTQAAIQAKTQPENQSESPSESPSENQNGLNRRAFVQRAGAIALALGLSELPLPSVHASRAKAYSQALAEKGGRKLALLIGIDNYAETVLPSSHSGSAKLSGAVTDVALQKELLIHRFGFAPTDIVILTNQQATREGIYEAFVSHLQRQATAGDTVVFHFSGYGSQVQIKSLSQNAAANKATLRSLVPYDGTVPTDTRPALNDILEIELKALLKQLKTKNITTIIDAGFVDI